MVTDGASTNQVEILNLNFWASVSKNQKNTPGYVVVKAEHRRAPGEGVYLCLVGCAFHPIQLLVL
jgi:hypothetical protein